MLVHAVFSPSGYIAVLAKMFINLDVAQLHGAVGVEGCIVALCVMFTLCAFSTHHHRLAMC